MSTIIQIIVGLAVLSLIVFVHEFGHFIVARMRGVRVIAFSIGFGKKIFKFNRGDTEYCLSALPFGGYVKLAGQEPDEEIDYGEKDFRKKRIWERAFIVFAGPLANFLFAVAVLWIVYMVGIREPISNADLTIGGMTDSSVARMAGVKIGDKLVSFNGVRVKNWEQFYTQIMMNGKSDIELALLRNGKKIKARMKPKQIEIKGIGKFGDIGLFSVEKPVIGKVADSSAALDAGLAAGDTIVEIGGVTLSSWMQLVNLVKTMERQTMFRIKRNDTVFQVAIQPRFNKLEKRYMIGIAKAPPKMVLRRYGPIAAFNLAIGKTLDLAQSMWKIVKALARRNISPKSVAGPVGIIQMTGNAAKLGFDSLILFIAMISINLAVINLLPLAITDGGVIMFLGIEKIRGKPLSTKIQLRIQQGAILFFISLFLLVTMNDLLRFKALF